MTYIGKYGTIAAAILSCRTLSSEATRDENLVLEDAFPEGLPSLRDAREEDLPLLEGASEKNLPLLEDAREEGPDIW